MIIPAKKHLSNAFSFVLTVNFTFSYLMDHSLLHLILRVISQMHTSARSQSLAISFFVLCVVNIFVFIRHLIISLPSSFYSKATLIDFIGLYHVPSRLYICMIDLVVLFLQSCQISLYYRYDINTSSQSETTSSPSSLPEQIDTKGVPIIADLEPLVPFYQYMGYETESSRVLPV